MKYLSIFFIAFFCMNTTAKIQAQADGITKYFNQYIDDDRFTSVYVSQKLFGMIQKMDLNAIGDIEEGEAKVAKEVLDQLKGLRVLTTEEQPLMFYKEALNTLKTNEYDLLLSVKDKGENVRIWTKDEGDIIHELLLLVGGEEEFVMLSLIGNIDLAKISTLAKAIDVDGIEHLDKINGNDND